MTTLKTNERIALLLTALFAAAAICVHGLANSIGSTALEVFSVMSLSGCLLATLAFLHSRFIRLAAEEKEELSAIQPRGDELFERETGVLDIRGRALRQYAGIISPVLSLVIALTQTGLVIYVLRSYHEWHPPDPGIFLPVGVFFLGMSVVFYFAGKYGSGLSSDDSHCILRGISGNALVAGMAAFATGLAFIIGYLLKDAETGFMNQAGVAGTKVLGFLALAAAAEMVFDLFLALYRRQGATDRWPPLYGGRLSGILADPTGVWARLSQIIDYQFGFSLSGMPLGQFLAGTAVPLLLLQLAVLPALSCLLFVNPGEQALLETCGRPVGKILDPGFYLKWPWPIQRVYRSRVNLVRSFSVGFETLKQDDPPGREKKLWGTAPPGAGAFIAGSSQSTAKMDEDGPGAPAVSLLLAETTVHYSITDLKKYTYAHADPVQMLKSTARRTAVSYFAAHDGLSLLKENLGKINRELTAELRGKTDSLDLGMSVLSAGITRIQPPFEVVAAFQDVIREMQNRETMTLEAERYLHQSVPAAETEASATITQANAAKARRVSLAEAGADRFLKRIQTYNTNKEIYRNFVYLDRLEKLLPPLRKIVMATDSKDQVIIMDFKGEITSELLDVSPIAGEENTK